NGETEIEMVNRGYPKLKLGIELGKYLAHKILTPRQNQQS
ncbi:MAG: hypothetical protein ACJA15_001741, partial [Flavobacteriales bacterium]